MNKLKATPELLEAILSRIPEGFIELYTLRRRLSLPNKSTDLDALLNETSVGREKNHLYDKTRVTPEQIGERARWALPTLNGMRKDGTFASPTIAEHIASRNALLEAAPEWKRVFDLLENTPGYAPIDQLTQQPDDDTILQALLDNGLIKNADPLVYDPLRLSELTVSKQRQRYRLQPLRQKILDHLNTKPGMTAQRSELVEIFGKSVTNEVLSSGGFITFNIQTPVDTTVWVRSRDANAAAARAAAEEAVTIKDEAWLPMVELAGERHRAGAKDNGSSARARVLAHTYTMPSAAKYFGVHLGTLEHALEQGVDGLQPFTDPEGKARLPASLVESADAETVERIAGYEPLRAKDIALALGMNYMTLRRRLRKEGISQSDPLWGEVRGLWGLPETLRDYRTLLKQRLNEWRELRELERDSKDRVSRESREIERHMREELRSRLLAAFPKWAHSGRGDQHITLHIGPPNSGKTHDALNRLATASSGWYLAPLRLLAYEVFDRLNRRGVYCNLLTGEEYIPVPGARITAATIEMFNPAHSGDVVIIDEAQMLADADRGWAWTRAMMESQAPEMHIIAPPTAQQLIEQLAESAAIPLTVAEHERLAPIKVAERRWLLQELPPRTILIAFSRQMVLHLKSELERMRRTVSVVYGNLPPEVRRRQADRFADEQTEICVATDAVGMGLNLPADYVCFYEVEKFDGSKIRILTPGEVQQIGGRAGRYGLSKAGEVGATSKRDLMLINRLFYEPPAQLTKARVAPTVEDLEMIPGTLAEKLMQWAALDSIPEDLRSAIEVADLTERVELARMLSDQQVKQLGLEAALKLVNAPTRQSTRAYWLRCAYAILSHQPLPLPLSPPSIDSSAALEAAEVSVSQADIYLWLSRRPEFAEYGEAEPEVRALRAEWGFLIDAALLRKVDTARRCKRCGAILPPTHRFTICNRCYNERFDYYD